MEARDDDLPFSESAIDFLRALEKSGITTCHLAKSGNDPQVIKSIVKILFENSNDTSRINNNLRKIMSPPSFFGPKDWRRYYGIKACFYTQFPMDIEIFKNEMEKKCPFNPEAKIKETHFLYFLPDDLEGKRLTIEKWHQIHDAKDKIRFYNYTNPWYANEDFVKNTTPRGEWHLIYKGIIPGSEEKPWEKQLAILPSNYRVPLACEVIPLYFFTCLKNKEYISKNIYGRVRDIVPNFRICVGRLDCNSINIVIQSDNIPVPNIGIFATRKLSI